MEGFFVVPPVLSGYLQAARIVGAAVTAIIVGFVSCSFGISQMGVQSLTDMAREVVRGREEAGAES